MVGTTEPRESRISTYLPTESGEADLLLGECQHWAAVRTFMAREQCEQLFRGLHLVGVHQGMVEHDAYSGCSLDLARQQGP
jgi:hypothetical protein